MTCGYRDSRRVWIWRNAALSITGFLSFVFGDIGSEIIQSYIPVSGLVTNTHTDGVLNLSFQHKEFQIGDVIANILGSALGLLSTPTVSSITILNSILTSSRL